MKTKFFLLMLVAFTLTSPESSAQKTFLQNNPNVILYTISDKVGIGTATPSDKLSVQSQVGETVLGLTGYSTQFNPFISLKDYRSRTILKLFGNSSYWTMGTIFDSTTCLLVGKHTEKWLRVNDYLYVKTKILTAGLSTTGNYNTTSYQQVDSTSGTAVTAGKQIVGVWCHSATTLVADTINLSNMAIGDVVQVVWLGSGGAGYNGKITIKAPAGHANLTAVFFPNGGSSTGATYVELNKTTTTKRFYKKDSTHIWVL